MHRILKPTGSLYLHIDHTAHAYAKALLDGIFGRENFRNEIVAKQWRKYGGYKNTASRKFTTETDTLLYYAKTKATRSHSARSLDRYQKALYSYHGFITDRDGEYKHMDEDGEGTRFHAGWRMYRQGIVKRVYLDEHKGVAVGSPVRERLLPCPIPPSPSPQPL